LSSLEQISTSIYTDPVSIVGGNIAVTELNAGSNAVILTARTGSITDGGDVGTDVTGGAVTLNASGLIGANGNELSLAGTTLATASSDNQFISESDSLTWITSSAGSSAINQFSHGLPASQRQQRH
jgi:hypothetical protein